MKSPLLLVLALSSVAAIAAPPGADVPVAPLRADHPFLGAWQLTRRDDDCAEIYRIDRSGRTLITSADEVAQSTFTNGPKHCLPSSAAQTMKRSLAGFIIT